MGEVGKMNPQESLTFQKSDLKETPISLKPGVIVLAGMSFTGKSTLGRQLQERTNCYYLDVDSVRVRMLGGIVDLKDEADKNAMENSYRRMFQEAIGFYRCGLPVVMGATFSREFYHLKLRVLSSYLKTSVYVFLLEIPEEERPRIFEERLRKRIEGDNKSPSALRTEEDLYLQVNRYRPPVSFIDPQKGVRVEVKSLDTTKFSEEETLQEIFTTLGQWGVIERR